MNSFEVNTLPYTVHTLLTYKTKDRYKGFIVRVWKTRVKKELVRQVWQYIVYGGEITQVTSCNQLFNLARRWVAPLIVEA